MRDSINDFAGVPSRRPAPEFTARVFATIGVDRYVSAGSALGDVFVAWRASGITAVRRADDGAAFEGWYHERFGRRAVPAIELDGIALSAQARLNGAADEIALDLSACSPFERRVLEKAAEIGSGNARPYSWVARELGMPDATRAVGNALGRNPVPLLVPCHRVIRSDGSVGGYVFGSERKRALLEAEGVDFGAVERVMKSGYRFIGCADGTFCLPTCGDVSTHLGEPGYRGLHDAHEAHVHGLVPCATCRPIAA